MAKICVVSPRLYLYFAPDLHRPAGGAQRQYSMICRELVTRGHEVSAIVSGYGQDSPIVHDKIKFVWGVPERVNGLRSKMYAAYKLGQAITSMGAEIYVVQGAPMMAMVTYMMARMNGGGFLFHVANETDIDPSHLRSKYTGLFLPFYKKMLRSSLVLSQTKHQKSLLKKRFGVQSKLAPNGYQLPESSEVLPAERRNHILWVGSSDPEQKNPRHFLELARSLPDLDFTMISQPIPGKKVFHRTLEEEAQAVPNLDFLGPVAPQEVHEYYRTALLLVNTSNYEGFPNTFLEAWRYETPVASLYFDLDGLLEKGHGGFRAGSMESLVSEVKNLVSDVSHRADLGAEGRTYMRKNYSLSRLVDVFEEAFQEILQ